MNDKTTIFAYDSSYAGVSFIADAITDNVILCTRNRKDFDEMIHNKIIFEEKSKHVLSVINSTDHLIIFGIISLSYIQHKHIIFPNIKKCTLIISDTTFKRNINRWNTYIKTHKNIEVLIMPDLIRFLNTNIKYRPYYQHINIDGVELQEKTNDVTISHSPGLKYKSNLKGTTGIIKVLQGYDLDVIHEVSWNECIRRKSKSHYFVDQIDINGGIGYSGGLGKSGLEAMLLGCLTITDGQPIVTEPYFPNPPVVYANYSTLHSTIEYYINSKVQYDNVVKLQKEWAVKYLSKDFVKNNILNGE